MRNALIGYTYQQSVTMLILSIMDVERKIDKLEIEADLEGNIKFDDVVITLNDKKYS
jgi:hypothetical protein